MLDIMLTISMTSQLCAACHSAYIRGNNEGPEPFADVVKKAAFFPLSLISNPGWGEIRVEVSPRSPHDR